jgi:hypothetical protein
MSTTRKPAAPRFYDVPAGTRASQCRGESCRATIYWVKDGEKSIPIDCDVDGGFEPLGRDEGSGVSHFTTCPDAPQFSRSKRS